MLEIKNLSVRYGAVPALDSVSLRVDEGEIVAVMGANGAGKSTLLKAVSGLVVPAYGEILTDGRALPFGVPKETVRRGVIHVPEGRRIFAEMTVGENLMIGAYALQEDGASKSRRADKILKMFPELAGRERQPGNQLSGGEQQMLAIARGLMAGPRLLMLDEPSMGLAPVVVDRVTEIIRTLQGEGVAILLAEQNIYFSLDIAQRVYVLETGRIVIDGPARTIAENPQVKSAYLGIGAS
jgi:branched-chain amino acid transport system ATP-binding protein